MLMERLKTLSPLKLLRTVFYSAPRHFEDIKDVKLDLKQSASKRILADYKAILSQRSCEASDIRLAHQGFGKLYYRIYQVGFSSAQRSNAIMNTLQTQPNRYADDQLGRFVKTVGGDDALRDRDRFTISLSGPWDGPVEVLRANEFDFSMVTLEGHLEAGLIQFKIADQADRKVVTIESWTRCQDRFAWVAYEVLGVAKKLQYKMWRYLLLKIAKDYSSGSMATDFCTGTLKLDEPGD